MFKDIFYSISDDNNRTENSLNSYIQVNMTAIIVSVMDACTHIIA